MFRWGIAFIIIALLLMVLGVGGGFIAWEIGKFLIIAAVVVFIISLLVSGRGPSTLP